MRGRVDPFATLAEPPAFEVKPKNQKTVTHEAIEHIAKEHNFPSRQAPKASPVPRRQPRRYRTGRNQQLNIKATGETIERFLQVADNRHVPLGELLRLALDALERAGEAR